MNWTCPVDTKGRVQGLLLDDTPFLRKGVCPVRSRRIGSVVGSRIPASLGFPSPTWVGGIKSSATLACRPLNTLISSCTDLGVFNGR